LLFMSALEEDQFCPIKKEAYEHCHHHCKVEWSEYEACSKRIEGDTKGEKHCTGQYWDFIQCADHCSSAKIFEKLK